MTKYITYHTSHSASGDELCQRAERTLDAAMEHGLEKILEGQKQFLTDFLGAQRCSDQRVPGTQRCLRRRSAAGFSLESFSDYPGCRPCRGDGLPAKGLTGQAYEGHYFWDTEIYVMPFLTYTAPRIARNLLKYRHSMLDRARQRAREVNQKGALFPWRTINGEEASSYYAAGTAQYHINADIIFALKKYVEATGDRPFLYNEGAEMLVETARLWLDLGFYSKRKAGKFCIQGVTGPDEYNTVVDQ